MSTMWDSRKGPGDVVEKMSAIVSACLLVILNAIARLSLDHRDVMKDSKLLILKYIIIRKKKTIGRNFLRGRKKNRDVMKDSQIYVIIKKCHQKKKRTIG